MTDSHIDTPFTVWVKPSDGGSGSGKKNDPFSSLEAAFDAAQPGTTIVLCNGDYHHSISIHAGGTIEQPLHITAEHPGQARILGACWFLYDVTDIILSGLVFSDAPAGAIAVIGACQRNRIEDVRFVNCGTEAKTPCTLFFGGAGLRCNIVENCTFIAPPKSDVESIGIMVTEGDDSTLESTNRDVIIRSNTFEKYSNAIILGTRGLAHSQFGHVVEGNIIRHCRDNGVLIKCGDVTVRQNVFSLCNTSAITIESGSGSTIESNRIDSCATGIVTTDDGHTIVNNCIIASTISSMHIMRTPEAESALIIEQNTCFNGSKESSDIHADKDVVCVARRNLFSGKGPAITIGPNKTASAKNPLFFVDDNIVAEKTVKIKGLLARPFLFTDEQNGNVENDSGYGSSGDYTSSPAPVFQLSAPDEILSEVDDDPEDPDALKARNERNQLLSKTFFFPDDPYEKDMPPVDSEHRTKENRYDEDDA
jgi:hypothetical protein